MIVMAGLKADYAVEESASVPVPSTARDVREHLEKLLEAADTSRTSRFDATGEIRVVLYQGAVRVFDVRSREQGGSTVFDFCSGEVRSRHFGEKDVHGPAALHALSALLERFNRGSVLSPEQERSLAATQDEFLTAAFTPREAAISADTGVHRPRFVMEEDAAIWKMTQTSIAAGPGDSVEALSLQVPDYTLPEDAWNAISERMGQLQYEARRVQGDPYSVIAIFRDAQTGNWILEDRFLGRNESPYPRVYLKKDEKTSEVQATYERAPGFMDERSNSAWALVHLDRWLRAWTAGDPVGPFGSRVR